MKNVITEYDILSFKTKLEKKKCIKY